MKLSFINSHGDINDFIKKVEIIMRLNKVLLENEPEKSKAEV